MNITLAWNGPVGVGRFPSDPSALEALDAPGVYLRVKTYAGGRTVSYVGQSKSLLVRIDQHLTSLLGLLYPLRDDAGAPLGRGDFADRVRAYNDIDATAAAALAEAKRMRFYLAPCDDTLGFRDDHLNLVEGALKSRIERQAAARAGADECENIQGVPVADFDDVVAIVGDFSALAPEDAETVATVVGAAPIEIAERALGLGHAE
jgi:hypothetical protein